MPTQSTPAPAPLAGSLITADDYLALEPKPKVIRRRNFSLDAGGSVDVMTAADGTVFGVVRFRKIEAVEKEVAPYLAAETAGAAQAVAAAAKAAQAAQAPKPAAAPAAAPATPTPTPATTTTQP